VKYETVIGLEVHVELATESKLFCSCSVKFGAGPNENVCPACAGMPGMPAVTNKKAIELAIAAAILTDSELTRVMTFDKKSYFYPDLPAGYQITQYFSPIARNGRVMIETGAGKKTITLKQIHIEEDAGKLVHDRRTGTSLVDFNRTSVPLIEIVSNPDFRSSDEVLAYLEKLRSLLSFAGVSDCKMQEGSMRCDVNISVREEGSNELGTRAEIKNMNSFKAIAAAIEYESGRHIDALAFGGETLVQETRGWDDEAGETFAMREKENATDYRYFPDPELTPVIIGDKWIDEIRARLPETADAKFLRLTERLGLPEYDARIITGGRNLSEIFDHTLEYFNNPKEVANWIIVELLGIAGGDNKGADDIKIDCRKFAELMKLVDDKTISRAVGKKLLIPVIKDGIEPATYVAEHGLGMVTDVSAIINAIDEVLAENKKSAAEYRSGVEKAYGFLMGHTMRKLGGRADPQAVGRLLKERLAGDTTSGDTDGGDSK